MHTLVIAGDALRADHLDQYGYDRDTMPGFGRLLDEGVLFTSAFSNGPYTLISIPSVHASRYLAYERIRSLPTISSTLRNHGITAACIGTQNGFESSVGHLHFDEYVNLGLDRCNKGAERSGLQSIARSIHSLARSMRPQLRDCSEALLQRAQRVSDLIVPGFGM